LKRLPELLSIRRNIIKCYLDRNPVVFIGIDFLDFNSRIEYDLHKYGIKIVYYVSPSVWAWRQGRIKKIKKSVDLMLTLLPFETDFYTRHSVPVKFVGHPLAGQIPLKPNTTEARKALGLREDDPVLCLMPGSRAGEVSLMLELFLGATKQLSQEISQLQVIIPAASEERYIQIINMIEALGITNVEVLFGQSHLGLEACDAVLLASGTTALEAMLFKKPMVVSYRLGRLTYKLVSPFIKTPFVSIPNLLAGRMLVQELLQNDACVPKLTEAVKFAMSEQQTDILEPIFKEMHLSLALDSGNIAASAIEELILT
jgi:lipid-A-disaccharide synthase